MWCIDAGFAVIYKIHSWSEMAKVSKKTHLIHLVILVYIAY